MPDKPYTREIIHEGEYLPAPSRSLPISTNTQTVAPDSSSSTPVRLNSPSIVEQKDDLNRVINTPSSLLPQTSLTCTPEASPYVNTNPLAQYPKLLHKWTHTHLILCVVASPSKKLLFCGTQDSKILVYDMVNYDLRYKIDLDPDNHCADSVLCLTLTDDENHLFCAGSNSIVKVWNLSNIGVEGRSDEIVCSHIIYSIVDIGDIFSLAWSSSLSTLFIGAQSASILWVRLCLKQHKHSESKQPAVDRLPYRRYDKFFDSKGPGGSVNPLQTKHQRMKQVQSTDLAPKLVEIKSEDIIRFAHNGYVYCMSMLPKESSYFLRELRTTNADEKDPENQTPILVSCGGDGMINMWEFHEVNKSLRLTKVKSLDNGESILSMSIQNYLYVGLSNSTINVWDLATLQLVRSFHFTNNNNDHNEVLSLGIHNGCIFKASNFGGLVKFTFKNPTELPHAVTLSSSQVSENVLLSSEDNSYNTFFDESDAVLAVNIFSTVDSRAYLASGGHKSLCLWDISNVGEKRAILLQTNDKEHADKFSNDDLLRRLKTYISFKTISKLPTLYLEDSRHCAQFLIKLFIELGSQDTKLLPVPNGNPIVYSRFKKNSKLSEDTTRVLWYAHYDVVNATDNEANDWKTDPFTLTALDGNLYARGVSDNKGPTLAAIYSVAELYHKGELSCDVAFVIEGEEECGSIGFQEAIHQNREVIGDIDWIMLSNSYWLDDETPCLNYGLRGVINALVTVKSDKPDRHAGVDGGVLKEPTMDLIHILGELVDRNTDRIQLDGFYDNVLELTKQESHLYQKIEQYALAKSINNLDLQTLTAKWRNPSLTVHKIQVSGPNNNTVIPQVAKATISIRIVPNQDLEKTKKSLVEFLKRKFDELGTENCLDVNIFHEAEPWLGDPCNLVYKLFYDNIKKNWDNTEPLYVREGGSIPSIRFLEKEFQAPAAQIPCGQASDNAHLKDEKLRVINLYKLRSILSDTFKQLGCHKLG